MLRLTAAMACMPGIWPSFGIRSGPLSTSTMMTHFLLTYDPEARTRKIRCFNDALEAFDAYVIAEREHLEDDLEVVLLGADSEKVLNTTHRRFLEDQLMQLP